MFKRRPQVYKYFIAYELCYIKDSSYNTILNTDIHLENEIKSIQQIWKIEKYIKNSISKEYIDDFEIKVTNFKLLDKSKDYVLTNLDLTNK